MTSPSPSQFFGWIQKHAIANGLKVKRHFAYHHPDGLLLELVTFFERDDGGPNRLTFDGEILYAPRIEHLIEMEIEMLVHSKPKEK